MCDHKGETLEQINRHIYLMYGTYYIGQFGFKKCNKYGLNSKNVTLQMFIMCQNIIYQSS